MGVVNGLLYPLHPRRVVSLLRNRGTKSKRLQRIQDEAAAEVAEVRKDDKYFGKNAPANEDDF
jgi:hypothetical protein